MRQTAYKAKVGQPVYKPQVRQNRQALQKPKKLFEPVDERMAFCFGNLIFICQYFEFSLLYNFMWFDFKNLDFICANIVLVCVN